MDLSLIKPKFHPQTPAAIQLYAQARELIKSNADLNTDVNNKGPLLAQAALSNDHASTALLLLSHGANPDVIDRLGKTPLLYAAELSAHRIIEALVYFGANPNHPCYQAQGNKSTPLHALCTPSHDSSSAYAIESRQTAVEWLLAAGANTNTQDVHGATPFFGLVSCWRKNSTSTLLASDQKKLFYSVRKNLIHAFLACKANPEISDICGKTLHTQTSYYVDPYLDMYVALRYKQRRQKLRAILLTFLKTSPNMPEAQSRFKQVPPDILRYILKIAYP
jgi:ankyrin repeat protein